MLSKGRKVSDVFSLVSEGVGKGLWGSVVGIG